MSCGPNTDSLALSVVIPTLGRPIVLETIRSLATSTLAGRLDVILVGCVSDQTLADRIRESAAPFALFKHLSVSFPAGDSSRKKTFGMREARCEIVAFLDDDVKVAPDWAGLVIEAFNPVGSGEPAVGMVSGPSLVPEDLPLMARLAGITLASAAAGYVAERYRKGRQGARRIKWSRIIGCNMAFRKKALERMGGFDPRFWPGEEMVAAFGIERAGLAIVFQPEACVWHYPRATLSGFARQMFGYGATRIRLIRHGLDCEPTTLAPAVMVAGFFALAAASFFRQQALFVLVACVVLYLLAAALLAILQAARSKRVSDLLMVFTIPIMHAAYGVAEWIELVRPGKDLSVTGPSNNLN